MVNLPKISNLPDKEELEFKEKEFFQSLYEQFQSTSKVWFGFLAVILILAFPLEYVLREGLARFFIDAQRLLVVNTHPYNPKDIEILNTQILRVEPPNYSLVTHLVNPNPELSAHMLSYKFLVKDADGKVLKEVSGKSFLLAGESKFLPVPSVIISGTPTAVEFVLDQVNWTARIPLFDVKLEVIQKNSGVLPEGNFFVEGLVKNLQGFGVKKVEVSAVIFDASNQNVVAVNSTVLTELKSFESRYFRMIWPKRLTGIGQIQLTAFVNLLDPGLKLENREGIPAR